MRTIYAPALRQYLKTVAATNVSVGTTAADISTLKGAELNSLTTLVSVWPKAATASIHFELATTATTNSPVLLQSEPLVLTKEQVGTTGGAGVATFYATADTDMTVMEYYG